MTSPDDILFYDTAARRNWCFRYEAERGEYEGMRLDNSVSVLRVDDPAYEVFMSTDALDCLAPF